jgi:hypothetical protein
MDSYDEREEHIRLKTYNSVWKIDRKLYSFEGVKLLFPVSFAEAAYFSGTLLLSIILSRIIPLYGKIHIVVRLGVIPFGVTKFFTKKKLDGKLPHKFFIDYLTYKLSPKQYERFTPVENYKNVRFVSKIIYRNPVIVDKTEIAITTIKKKGWRR